MNAKRSALDITTAIEHSLSRVGESEGFQFPTTMPYLEMHPLCAEQELMTAPDETCMLTHALRLTGS